MKNPSCTRTLPGPVRPVGPTGQTGRSLPDRPQCLNRSDRSVRPVRPVGANFGCQQSAYQISYFFGCLRIRLTPSFYMIWEYLHTTYYGLEAYYHTLLLLWISGCIHQVVLWILSRVLRFHHLPSHIHLWTIIMEVNGQKFSISLVAQWVIQQCHLQLHPACSKRTPSPTGSSAVDAAQMAGSQDQETIDVVDDDTIQPASSNGRSDARTDRRLNWSNEEDIRLVS